MKIDPTLPSIASIPSLPSLPAPASSEREKIEQACIQFEGLFIAQMFKQMQQANEHFKAPSSQEDPTQSLLAYTHDLVAQQLAQQRSLGIADTLIAQFTGETPHEPHQ